MLAVVEGLELVAAHINLGAHFENVGCIGGKGGGNIGNGAEIGGDVLAGGAVTSRRPLHEGAFLVAQGDREAIDLRLAHQFHGFAFIESQKTPDALDEGGDVGFVEGVVEREHGFGMGDLGEAGGRFGAHALRGAVVADEIGEFGLDGGIALAQGIVLGVADEGRVLLVVGHVMGGDIPGQGLEFFGRLERGQVFNRRRGGCFLGRFFRGHGLRPIAGGCRRRRGPRR